MAVVAREGCYLHYMVRGNGPPILFIQGVGVQGDGWLPQIDELSAEFTCISFDNRGMGRSDPAAGGPIGSCAPALAAAIPGARYVEVPDASHTLPITHADLTNQLLREHLGVT